MAPSVTQWSSKVAPFSFKYVIDHWNRSDVMPISKIWSSHFTGETSTIIVFSWTNPSSISLFKEGTGGRWAGSSICPGIFLESVNHSRALTTHLRVLNISKAFSLADPPNRWVDGTNKRIIFWQVRQFDFVWNLLFFYSVRICAGFLFMDLPALSSSGNSGFQLRILVQLHIYGLASDKYE